MEEDSELTPMQLRANRRRGAKIRRLRSEARKAETENATKVVTFDDLDGDQLIAYNGIIEWWNTMMDCGGVADPLIVSGFAGCGKSTLISLVVPTLTANGVSICVRYCAYTGKAASVLIAKGLPASTIHSLIYNYEKDQRPRWKNDIKHETDPDKKKRIKLLIKEYSDKVDNRKPDESGKIFVPKDREEIEADLIVVDEASQVPDDMRCDLEALGIPILYTGDHGQLKPVEGFGNIMENPHFKLEKPHRQALDSGIIQMATLVRTGKSVKKGSMGVKNDAHKVSKSFINDIKLLVRADMVICYTNKMRNKLNKDIRKYKGYDGMYPECGERIICIKNNSQTGMFNGLILYIESIRIEGGYLMMDCVDETGVKHLNLRGSTNYFEGHQHPKVNGKGSLDLFEFAYALTAHKCQGSEWCDVVVVEEVMHQSTLEERRRWLYTACTRSSNKLYWISRFN